MVSHGVMVFVYRGLKKNTDAACGAGLRSLCMVLLRGNHNQTSAHGGTVRSRRGSPVWLCIALYGNVRCPGRGHDIVKSHTARYRGRAHDITTRVRYRAAIVLSCVCAISCAGRDIVGARDIAGPRCNIVRFLTISWPGRGIVPTRVIVSARRDIVQRDRISPRALTISRVCGMHSTYHI